MWFMHLVVLESTFLVKNVMKGLARVLIGACVFSVGREDDPSRLRLGALFSR